MPSLTLFSPSHRPDATRRRRQRLRSLLHWHRPHRRQPVNPSAGRQFRVVGRSIERWTSRFAHPTTLSKARKSSTFFYQLLCPSTVQIVLYMFWKTILPIPGKGNSHKTQREHSKLETLCIDFLLIHAVQCLLFLVSARQRLWYFCWRMSKEVHKLPTQSVVN